MEKPIGYEETRAAGFYEPMELGGHYLVIKHVIEKTSKTGKPMLQVMFDTADNDKQPHYYKDQYLGNTRQDKKWPNGGVSYIVTVDDNGKCSSSLKGFVTSVEQSNPGYTAAWGSGFCDSLKNKIVGGVYRTEIGWWDDKEIRTSKLAWFCPNDKVATAKIPNEVETEDYKKAKERMANNMYDTNMNSGFEDLNSIGDEELPFV